MGEFSFTHILLVLVIVLIFFGPSRLPGLGSSLGKAIRGFKDGMKEINDDSPKTAATSEQIQARQTTTEIKKETDRTTTS